MRAQWLFVGIVGGIIGLSSACTVKIGLWPEYEDGHVGGDGGGPSSSNTGGGGGGGGGGASKPRWEKAPHDMKQARAEHSMTKLADGRVLITGGFGLGAITNALDSTEIWDPKTNEFTLMAPMNSRRARHTATLLTNGNVVVTGGYNGSIETNSIEVYDPIANTWTQLPETLKVGRMYHGAVLLPNDQLLTASGCCDFAYQTAETTAIASTMPLFPVVVTPITKGPMQIAHAGVTLTLLLDGRALLVGNALLKATELYDPASESWQPAADLNIARNAHTANLDASGKVIVAGGVTIINNFEATLNSVEEYDPATNQWTFLPPMQQARRYHSGTVVKMQGEEDIVWAGGITTSSNVLSSCERDSSQPCPDLNVARRLHRALVVSVNGQERVMVTGGYDSGDQATNSVEWLRW